MFRFSFRKMATFGVATLICLLGQSSKLASNLYERNKISSMCWSLGKDISEERANWGFDIAKQEGIDRLRVYDSMPAPNRFLQLAKERGIRVTMGAWLSTKPEENAEQLETLRSAIKAELVEPIAIVGSEALLFKNVNLEQLIGHIEETKRALPEQVAVTTAELFEVLIKNPRLIEAQRHIVGLHYYPFAHAVPIDQALQDLVDHYNQIKALSGDKKVVIYETGWPSAGNAVGDAVPSIENQKKYNREVADWAHTNNVDVYFFQIIDEPWKLQFIENTYEAHWGWRKADGSPKY